MNPNPKPLRYFVWSVGRLALVGALALLPACTLIGGVAENYRKDSTHPVEAEYVGLAGKSFAVVVSVDRSVEAETPGLQEHLTRSITRRLADPTITPRAGAYAPADQVLKYMYNNPSWVQKSRADLAKGLGNVERIVYIEINAFQLRQPGNAYEWDGSATAHVSVIEADGARPEDYAFERTISVRFPGKSGYGPNDYSATTVASALSARLIDRASWLMYTHEEPYYPEY